MRLSESPKINQWVFSRALTTVNHHYVPEDDIVSLNNQISTFIDGVSAPDGLHDVPRLQQLNDSPRNPYFFNKILSYCARLGVTWCGNPATFTRCENGFLFRSLYMHCSCWCVRKMWRNLKFSESVRWNALEKYSHLELFNFWLFTC